MGGTSFQHFQRGCNLRGGIGCLMSTWPLAFSELFVVLAFVIGWLILEWQCRRLDRLRAKREDSQFEQEKNQPAD
ncbi:MAG: hypothetical protein ABL893_17015 [Hyphomicrobium sp.]